jgi:hypothetical protein
MEPVLIIVLEEALTEPCSTCVAFWRFGDANPKPDFRLWIFTQAHATGLLNAAL